MNRTIIGNSRPGACRAGGHEFSVRLAQSGLPPASKMITAPAA